MPSDRSLASPPHWTSVNSTPDLTPEEVQTKLQDQGLVTGEVITDGANMGVARSGELDANAHLGVEYTPEQERLYVGIYFFDSPEQAETLAQERTEDRDFHVEVIGDTEFEIAGSSDDLSQVIDAVQAPG